MARPDQPHRQSAPQSRQGVCHGCVIGSLSGFYLALNIPPGYFAYAMGLFFLCVAWVTNTGMALWCIRQRQIEQHREWMIRSYVVTFAFVSIRLVSQWLHDYYHQPDVDVADDIGTALAWASWAVRLGSLVWPSPQRLTSI